MINPVRQEVLQALAEISELAPEVRLGQLMVNLSYMARGLSDESIWDMEDDELLAVARKHWRNGAAGAALPRTDPRARLLGPVSAADRLSWHAFAAAIS